MTKSRETNILDRLETYFLEHGVRDATVGKLAQEMRCSRRRLYELADSKDALIQCVLLRLFERVQNEGVQAAAQEKDIDRKIRAYFAPGLEAARRLRGKVQKDFEEIPALKALYDTHQRLRTQGLRDIIKAGIDRGEVSGIDERIAAEMMFLTVQRIREPSFQEATGMTYAEGLEAAYTILHRGMLLKPSGNV